MRYAEARPGARALRWIARETARGSKMHDARVAGAGVRSVARGNVVVFMTSAFEIDESTGDALVFGASSAPARERHGADRS